LKTADMLGPERTTRSHNVTNNQSSQPDDRAEVSIQTCKLLLLH